MSAFVPTPIPRRWLAGLAAMAALALGLTGAQAQVSTQRIAAIVNDDVITSQDLDARLGLVLATSGVPNDPETKRRLQQQVLRGFIDEKLELQEAKRLKLDVSDAEIDRALASIAQRNRLDLAGFRKVLADRKVDESVLRAQLRGQIAWAKVVNRELRPRVSVSDEQLGLAMKDATAGDEDIEFALSEILLPVESAGQEAQAVRDAQGLVATLRNGADFAALARQVSIASSAEKGGDLGWVRPSMILPELRQKLAGLAVGGISDPIPSPVGVHIFKVRERRDPNQPPPPPPQQQQTVKRFVPTRVQLAQVVLPLAPAAKDPEIKAMQKRAVELAPKLKSCGDIEAYAQRTGSEGSGALGWIAVKDLPGVLRQLVSQIEPNRISPVFRGPLGVQMLMVCDRQGTEETTTVAAAAAAAPAPPPPPPPAPPTRDEMRRRLEDEQLQRLASRYLRELHKDAFIDVRDGA